MTEGLAVQIRLQPILVNLVVVSFRKTLQPKLLPVGLEATHWCMNLCEWENKRPL